MLAIAYAHQFVKLCLALQAIAEIGIGAARLRRPARFGHGGEALQGSADICGRSAPREHQPPPGVSGPASSSTPKV